MRKRFLRTLSWAMLAVATLLPVSAHAFSAGTHLHIAERVFPESSSQVDLHYGSFAPDLAFFLNKPHKWPTAFQDTHYDLDFRPHAKTAAQKSFAEGWATHMEKSGADFYAHITYNGAKGYVIQKEETLVDELGIDPAFAHLAVEVAVDLLIKWNDDPSLGIKLLKAAVKRSPQDRLLLSRVLVHQQQKTDLGTLVSGELLFRAVMMQYAKALSLPFPRDKEALIGLAVQLGAYFYELAVTPEEASAALERALQMCEGDYKQAIADTVDGIRSDLLP